ncbi:glycosyltransferase family 9 protein [Nakamurella leprariae]|uniref:Glycosyltransferase family 9 protein n=1 Tax=Nakamurella leprariae TaxID=2803911 RepID=A0A939C3S7_9ACTN|nr:glycosyltransferase family 9 protein [Nakamurella leprariae]MBM9469377.1 glycosyltransferase family 9 protein [Nakamurella leprariae]
MTRVLAVRLDSDGDVLLTGPAIRALAGPLGPGDQLDLLVSPAGAQAGRLLPDVTEVLVFAAPWTGFRPPPVDLDGTTALVAELTARGYGRAVIFTSFHQSPLPMALLARLAGIPSVAATSVDYPGSLLDLRHVRPEGHEVTAALDLALAAGGRLPAGDDGRLAVRRPLPDVTDVVPVRPYVVLHPAASVPSRGITAAHAGSLVAALGDAGWPVLVTGGPADRGLTAATVVAAGGVSSRAVDLAGRTSFAELAAVLDGAACVVVGNTGPAHLAAAVGTPVVSLFSPVVPADRWAPYGVPTVLLGDQDAACRDTRARDCPVPGHPCLTGIGGDEVVAAVARLTGVLVDGAAGTAAGQEVSV